METVEGKDQLIIKHYRGIAETHGESPRSSMEDEYVRERELEWITGYFRRMQQRHPALRVLDLGCGNGYALARLSAEARTGDQLTGLDFSPDLLEIARKRQIRNCTLLSGDARHLSFESNSFDFAYTERCVINILDAAQQLEAVAEIARVLKPGADYLMIEAFTDGLDNNNKARAECGMGPIGQAIHNLYFDKDAFFHGISNLFDVVCDGTTMPSNFLSSYYFISRVLYPSLTKTEVVRNSEMAKFFSFLPPMGNYSPIQAYVLRKKH